MGGDLFSTVATSPTRSASGEELRNPRGQQQATRAPLSSPEREEERLEPSIRALERMCVLESVRHESTVVKKKLNNTTLGRYWRVKKSKVFLLLLFFGKKRIRCSKKRIIGGRSISWKKARGEESTRNVLVVRCVCKWNRTAVTPDTWCTVLRHLAFSPAERRALASFVRRLSLCTGSD